MKYNQQHKDFLRDNQHLTRLELTTAFNKEFDTTQTYSCIHQACKRFKFRTNRNTKFKPGHKSWNAGSKGLTSANKTSFKKGQKPHNHKPVGHERITVDGYIEVKTSEPKTFELKHRLVWQHHNGKLPNDMIITFKDGDTTNCNIENLEAITRQEHVRRNKLKIKSYPQELQPTIKLIAKIQTKASKLKEA